MDWKLCLICQNETREPLQCPAMSKQKDVGASYASFARNLEEFHDIGSVPGHLKAGSHKRRKHKRKRKHKQIDV